MDFPDPVIDVAIEPKTKAGQEKMGIALSESLLKKIQHLRHILIKKQVRQLSGGMGELHLEIIVDRLQREFKVECNVGKPQVAYKKLLEKLLKLKVSLLDSLVDVDSMVTAVIEMIPTEGDYDI